MSEKQLSFDCAMKIVNKQKWIQIKDIERLEKFIQNQQATISALKEENEKLRFLIDINSVSERRKLERQVDEQQATIRKLQDLCGKSDYENAKLRLKNKELQEEIKLLKPTNVEQYEQIVQLQEENEQLQKKNKILEEDVNDYHNALFDLHKKYDKLEKENEQLKQKVDFYKYFQKDARELEKENEQLKDDLHNCRLNKNIISEKLKMWQDVHKEYDIYNIKDFKELMKNDK